MPQCFHTMVLCLRITTMAPRRSNTLVPPVLPMCISMLDGAAVQAATTTPLPHAPLHQDEAHVEEERRRRREGRRRGMCPSHPRSKSRGERDEAWWFLPPKTPCFPCKFSTFPVWFLQSKVCCFWSDLHVCKICKNYPHPSVGNTFTGAQCSGLFSWGSLA